MRNHAVSMREVSIVKERFGIASCNVCFGRNYDPDAVNTLGEYKESLYNLHIGNLCMCLCKDCLRLIDKKIVAFLDEEAGGEKEE